MKSLSPEPQKVQTPESIHHSRSLSSVSPSPSFRTAGGSTSISPLVLAQSPSRLSQTQPGSSVLYCSTLPRPADCNENGRSLDRRHQCLRNGTHSPSLFSLTDQIRAGRCWDLRFVDPEQEIAYRKHTWESSRKRYLYLSGIGFVAIAIGLLLTGRTPGYAVLMDVLVVVFYHGGLLAIGLALPFATHLMEAHYSKVSGLLFFLHAVSVIVLRMGVNTSNAGSTTFVPPYMFFTLVMLSMCSEQHVYTAVYCIALAVMMAIILVVQNRTDWVLSLIYLAITAVAVSSVAYRSERVRRNLFAQKSFYQTQHFALKEELYEAQRTVRAATAAVPAMNIESPLEQANQLIARMLSDTALPAHYFNRLTRLNLLINSVDRNDPMVVFNDGNRMDFDTEAWLYSELSARNRCKKRNGKPWINGSNPSIPTQNSSLDHLADVERPDKRIIPSSNAEFLEYVVNEAQSNGELLPPEVLENVWNVLKNVDKWSFPIFELDTLTRSHGLITLSFKLFQEADLFQHFQIDKGKFFNYMILVEQGYHSSNPYHNRIHAADVLQTSHYFLKLAEIESKITALDYLIIYFAAIIHDIDHPGVNNNFLVNSRDSKALLYNDISVLENHHAAVAFILLDNEEVNFMSCLPTKDWKRFREEVVEIVLATDLSHHFQFIAHFKARMSAVDAEGKPAFDARDKSDKLLLKKLIVKSADVSHPAKSQVLHHTWSRLVLREFFMQGNQERELKLPVSPFMDRTNCKIASSQVGFIEYLCYPIYEAFSILAPLHEPRELLEKNRLYWNERKVEEDNGTLCDFQVDE